MGLCYWKIAGFFYSGHPRQLVSALLLVILLEVTAAPPGAGGHEPPRPQMPAPVEEAEMVLPYQVDHSGREVLRELPHHRERRSAPDTTVYFKINASVGDLHLKLMHNLDLLAPGFSVYRRRSTHRNESKFYHTHKEPSPEHCFYTGHLVAEEESSSIALSLCDGMVGVIHTANHYYLIEPAATRGQHGTALPQGHGPHKFYKMSASQKPTQFCEKNTSGKSLVEQAFKYAATVTKPHIRERRSASNKTYMNLRVNYPRTRNSRDPYNVETLVVVDKTMMDKHSERNITTYVLSILNMVSSLFHHKSIGKQINIVLVALVLLEGDEPGLVLGHHADRSLTTFCHWQSHLETKEGMHHDHAMLLTGVDICSYKDAPCDTLGFAPIKGMCKRHQSCTINEDTGLSTAFTIAHEAGHNFGMFHDGEGNYCSSIRGSIMAPFLAGNDGVFKWSACSRKYLYRFLKSSQASCLSDKPQRTSELKFPDQLPGEIYGVNTQCKWQFGHKARLCTFSFAKYVCKALWCHNGGPKCETKFLPAAEGTSCGASKWCRKGQCVAYGKDGPAPIDGTWSLFSNWSACSRSCGGGVMFKERLCNNPRPQFGGRDCNGDSRMYKMCNDQDCPAGSLSYRAVQCRAFNNKPFRGWYYKWKPYTGVTDRMALCRLYCKADKYDFFFGLAPQVVDGTPCKENSKDVCVHGMCKRAGCDGILDSTAVLDRCGVCDGDNSTCTLITGNFTEELKPNEYHTVTIIPRGAMSIWVQELGTSPSHLAVRAIHGKYLLTGNWTETWPGKFGFAGTLFVYKRPHNGPEQLQARGPTSEDIIIQVLAHSPTNPGVRFEYTMARPIADTSNYHPQHKHTWDIAISRCSSTCATGYKTVKAKCLRNFKTKVDDLHCDESKKLKTGKFKCNEQPCPPRWVSGDWKACSRTCGGGRQRRPVQCKQRMSHDSDYKVHPRLCRHLVRPVKRRDCNNQDCPPLWRHGRWSKCSNTCGLGVRERKVLCHSGLHIVPDERCSNITKPNRSEECTGPCDSVFKWFLSSWGQCSVTCGEGKQERSLQCSGKLRNGRFKAVESWRCKRVAKPRVPLKQKCHQRLCDKMSPHWSVSSWSQCTKTCGPGIQTRRVKCVGQSKMNDINPGGGCGEAHKPPVSQDCTNAPCSTGSTECKDQYPWCPLVPKHKICNHRYFGNQCCKTCYQR